MSEEGSMPETKEPLQAPTTAETVSEAAAGSTSDAAPPAAPVRTLASMWGKDSNGSDSAGTPPVLPLSSAPPAPARKRRKKDAPNQARLVFAPGGVAVTAPPPVEEKKRRGKRKSDENEEDIVVVDPSVPPKARKRKATKNVPDISILSPSSSEPELPDSDVVITGAVPARRKAPSGSRATSPIAVEEKLPKKIVFANDVKPAHSFFSKRANGVTTAGDDAQSILQDPSADTPAAPIPVSKPHSFFNMAVRAQGVHQKGWGCCREGEEPPAPWPRGDWPSHVGASSIEPVEPRVMRRPRETSAVESSEIFDSSILCHAGPSRPQRSARPIVHHTSMPFMEDHPAIAAVASAPLDERESWCAAHRPRTAAAVLGNELEATYLRDWLKALSVGSREARRIIRRVPRRKAADPDKDWIVDDLYAEPFSDDIYEEMPEAVDEPTFPLGSRPDTYPAIDYWIGNALLLTGPGGCGKTAAVYAAADELGWDVFEVYPGLGKRTGANLLALVGDVGKNHMVNEKKEKKSTAEAAKAMFSKASVKAGSQEEPVVLDDSPKRNGNAENGDHNVEATMKQSLILIDEADILFEEESTFWPAVVALIAESHRPVVITCNDVGRIPRNSLPIHTTLYFHPAPSYQAQAYLDAVARRHGLRVDAAELYAQCSLPPVTLLDQPLPPNGNEPQPMFDLRAAITQMQLDRARSPLRVIDQFDGINESSPVDELAQLVRRLDVLSFTDAFVAPPMWARIETVEIDRQAAGPDDEDGIRQLFKPDVQNLHPTLAGFDHTADIARTLALLVDGEYPLSNRASPLQLAQTDYVRAILPVLDEVVDLACRLLPHGNLFTETMPYLRQMVRADDMLEEADRAAVAAGEGRVNRQTGRAMRVTHAREYIRHLRLKPNELEVTRSGGLEWRD